MSKQRRERRIAQLEREYKDNPELLAKKLKDLRKMWYETDSKTKKEN